MTGNRVDHWSNAMGTRSRRTARCIECRLHLDHCQCRHRPHIHLQTKLVLVMHKNEWRKPTATGLWALGALPHHELRLHGVAGAPLDLSDLFEEQRRVMVLFPGAGSTELPDARAQLPDGLPVTLVVPDGSWRQAQKMSTRIAGLAQATRVTLPPGPPTEWGVRRETRPGGLATFEAIARSVGCLECVDAQRALEGYFRHMVRATFRMRGSLPPPRYPGEATATKTQMSLQGEGTS